MRLTITPADLAAALAIAKPFVGNGKQIPAVGMVLLEASVDGGLTVSSTNLETRAWRQVLARVDDAGAVALDPAALAGFLDVCPDAEPITITTNDKHKADLVCGRAQIKLAGLDPELFPAAASFDAPSLSLTLGAQLLAELIGRVAHAVMPDRSREVMAGIQVSIRNGTLTLAAADGYRLAVATAAVEDVPDLSLIVVGEALEKVGKVLAGATEVRLTGSDRQSALLMESEAGSWAIRVIEGQFPDFKRIIPRDSKVQVTVNRERLRKAAQLMRGIEHTATGDIVRLTVGEATVRVRAADNAEDRVADVELDAEVYGGPMVAAFNGKYLTEALGALESENVLLELNGGASPGAITEPGSRDNVQVVMPMAVARGAS